MRPIISSEFVVEQLPSKATNEGFERLFKANLDQLLGRPLGLAESQATKKERWLEFVLNHIILSGTFEREKSTKIEEEKETTR